MFVKFKNVFSLIGLITFILMASLHFGENALAVGSRNSSPEIKGEEAFTFKLQSKSHRSVTFKPYMGKEGEASILEAVVNDPEVAKHTCYRRPWREVDGVMERTLQSTPERWVQFFEANSKYEASTTHLVWIGVAEDGLPVARGGFAPLKLEEFGHEYVSALFLHMVPEYQKDGIGSALLERIKGMFPESCFSATLDSEHQGLQPMIERAGFKAVKQEASASASAKSLKTTFIYKP